MKKVLCLVLSLSLCLMSNPLHSQAAHYHTDNCYVAGCSRHTHSASACGAKWQTTKDYGLPCWVCNGTGKGTCGGTWVVQEAEQTSSTGTVSITKDKKCDKCNKIVLYYSETVNYSGSNYSSRSTTYQYTETHGCDNCRGNGYRKTDVTASSNSSSGGGASATVYFVEMSCGKDGASYYNGSTVVAASCNSVVKSLNTKK